MERDDGTFRFVKPEGRIFDSPAPRATDWTALGAAHDSAEIRITPIAAVSDWTGEALEYDLAVGCLMERAKRAKTFPRERFLMAVV